MNKMATDSIEQIDLITKFESMSNELIMELFGYYDLYSLYYSFGSLNSRIDNIILHCQVFVDFDQVKPIDFVDFIRDILPKFNAKNIRSLYASNQYQIGVLAYDKSLLYFTHIRSITLNNIQLDIVEYMFSHIHFSRLERILLDKCVNEYMKIWSCFKHLFDSNRYQFIRTYKDPCPMIQEVTSVLLIEYAKFSGESNPCDFLNFLNQSPCLKSIETQLFFSNEFTIPVFLSPIPYHNTLTHLNLQLMNQVCMKTTVYIIKCVPQICYLKLKIEPSGDLELADPTFWETLLSQYLMKLKRLSLKAFIFNRNVSVNPIWNFLKDKQEVFKRIEESNYWSSHQWGTKFNSGMGVAGSEYYWASFEVLNVQ